MKSALLLADPEETTRGHLERQLTDDGFDVLGAAADAEALTLVEQLRPDLVLAEPDLCRRLREGEPGRSWNRDVPVIVITPEEADQTERVGAFARGADDVVDRPVQYDELVARIRAVLRRAAPAALPESFESGDLVVDRRTRRVTVRGENVVLAGREFALLLKLATEPRRVFTKEELLREVWGFRSLGRTRTLDSHASRLRRKLNRGALDHFVVNVWGVGYRLVD